MRSSYRFIIHSCCISLARIAIAHDHTAHPSAVYAVHEFQLITGVHLRFTVLLYTSSPLLHAQEHSETPPFVYKRVFDGYRRFFFSSRHIYFTMAVVNCNFIDLSSYSRVLGQLRQASSLSSLLSALLSSLLSSLCSSLCSSSCTNRQMTVSPHHPTRLRRFQLNLSFKALSVVTGPAAVLFSVAIRHRSINIARTVSIRVEYRLRNSRSLLALKGREVCVAQNRKPCLEIDSLWPHLL